MRVACGVLSYKMPELTSKTVQAISKAGFERGVDLFVFENQNGPNAQDYTKDVTHFTGGNYRMTGGFNHICEWFAEEVDKPDVLWLCTNDFEILAKEGSIKERIERAFEAGKTGWWHPSLEPIQDYAYPWMFTNGTKTWTPTWMTDFICPAIDFGWLEAHRDEYGHYFDPAFYRGWGIDYETCYKLRENGLEVKVDHGVQIKHEASKTYLSGTAPESKDEFYGGAIKEMQDVLTRKYGAGWHDKFRGAMFRF